MRGELVVLIWCAIALFSLFGLNTDAYSSSPGVKTGMTSMIVVPDDYSTIQEAVNDASYGDTVFVKSGTYYEHVIVNRTILLLGEDSSTTIIDGNNTGHVVIIVSNNVTVSGFTLRNSGNVHMPALEAGICLNSSTDCVVSGNRLIDNGFCGISLLNSHRNLIVENNVSRSSWGGIHLMASSYNTISGNIVDSVYGGINGHASSHYNNFTENVISNSTHGMFFNEANRNSICRNNISDSLSEGIWLQDRVNYNIVADNILMNNKVAILLAGPNDHNVLSRNFITGAEFGIKIINAQYTSIESNIIVNNHAGTDLWRAGIRLENARDSRIQFNSITGNYYGILLYSYSPRVSVYKNDISSNEFGFRVASGGSNNLIMTENQVANNIGYGIGVTGFGGSSNYAIISGNTITNNSDGIALGQYSDYNTIVQNNISMNNYGFYIEYSTQNVIYGNNIENNRNQTFVAPGSVNTWDCGYPTGGNFWSNYIGMDADDDGIGDVQYVIDENNQDDYPLMHPWKIGDTNYDGEVNVTDLIVIANALGTRPQDPKWNPRADVKKDLIINVLDLIKTALRFGS